MASADLIIRSRRVVLSDGVMPASIHISDGIILRITDWDEARPGTVDAGDSVIMPGLVDAHVHINDPGRAEWEGFETATRAAAAGGVTTLVDMPLNSIPPTTTLAGFREKLAAADGKCTVDVAFWGGVVPGNKAELEPMLAAGVRGFKCFLIHSGVDEFPNVTESDLLDTMPEIARLGTVLLVHAELPGPIEEAAVIGGNADSYKTFLDSRPRAAENEAIEFIIGLCRKTGARAHIVHLSSSDALASLQTAKAEGLPITVETCPHYLTLAAEDIAVGATHFKCCPPVRERENREKLWQAIHDGVIDMVVSDHSPCTPELKCGDSGDFLQAWGGIAALQFSLPVMWTNFRKRSFEFSDLSRLMSATPAKLVGLDHRKGRLAAGYDADIVIFNPDEKFTVEPELIHHRHKLTPYAERELFGKIEQTIVRGKVVFDRGMFAGGKNGNII